MERKLSYIIPVERTRDNRLLWQLKRYRLNVREYFLNITIEIDDLQSGTF